ncbi:MAG: uracil-DNA glycosylase [Pseudomonadota bacterium]
MAQAPQFLTSGSGEPDRNCAICPRLAEFVAQSKRDNPDWFAAPVPTFGDRNARLLVVGLAPGLKGANRTGRPFTGDYAGDLLYKTLGAFGFAGGTFDARPDDDLRLIDCAVTNAVRCVPPANKPTGAEIKNCRQFLTARIQTFPKLRAIVCLGRIAHTSVIAALGGRQADHPFGHGHQTALGAISVFDSYHCSRYNTNTGRLTEPMFHDVFAAVRAHLDD